MMKITQIEISKLDQYNKIPMLKIFDCTYVYHSLDDYTIQPCVLSTIDMSKEESMEEWMMLFDPNHCGVFVIEESGKWIGGCVVVTHSPKIHMLRGDYQNAVLWDIRVDLAYQKLGIGKQLFEHAIHFAQQKGCTRLLIETQNNNPTAIQFYQKQGATLLEVNKNHYDQYPEEDQLIFSYII